MAKPISHRNISRDRIAETIKLTKDFNVIEEPLPKEVIEGDDPADDAATPANVMAILGFDPNDEAMDDNDNPHVQRDNIADKSAQLTERPTGTRKKSICRKPTARKAKK